MHLICHSEGSLCKTTWSLRHRPGAGFGKRNHESSPNEAVHTQHRQLSSFDASKVQQFANAGVAPKEIRSYLHMNSDMLVTQQYVYNCIAGGK